MLITMSGKSGKVWTVEAIKNSGNNVLVLSMDFMVSGADEVISSNRVDRVRERIEQFMDAFLFSPVNNFVIVYTNHDARFQGDVLKMRELYRLLHDLSKKPKAERVVFILCLYSEMPPMVDIQMDIKPTPEMVQIPIIEVGDTVSSQTNKLSGIVKFVNHFSESYLVATNRGDYVFYDAVLVSKK
jgi:hypothetical protein